MPGIVCHINGRDKKQMAREIVKCCISSAQCIGDVQLPVVNVIDDDFSLVTQTLVGSGASDDTPHSVIIRRTSSRHPNEAQMNTTII